MLPRDMADYLTTSGGWTQAGDLFITEAPSPDRVQKSLTLYDGPGLGPKNAMGVHNIAMEFAVLQAIGRDVTYEGAWQLTYKAYLQINALPARTLNGVRYEYAEARSVPYPMGRDPDTKLFLCAVNFDVLKDKSTTS